MSGKTVTRADLYQAIYQKIGLSRTQSATLVELVLKEITDCLERGETVKLSSFGLFVVRKKGQRMGRNPKTGLRSRILSMMMGLQRCKNPPSLNRMRS
jgi:integration host factor subunit alpha